MWGFEFYLVAIACSKVYFTRKFALECSYKLGESASSGLRKNSTGDSSPCGPQPSTPPIETEPTSPVVRSGGFFHPSLIQYALISNLQSPNTHVKRNHPSHLLHEQSGPNRPIQHTDPARHLPRLLPRRQDRCARSYGAGKSTLLSIMAGVDKYTSARYPIQRLHCRLARAGTQTRRKQDRTRSREIGGRAHRRNARPLR